MLHFSKNKNIQYSLALGKSEQSMLTNPAKRLPKKSKKGCPARSPIGFFQQQMLFFVINRTFRIHVSYVALRKLHCPKYKFACSQITNKQLVFFSGRLSPVNKLLHLPRFTCRITIQYQEHRVGYLVNYPREEFNKLVSVHFPLKVMCRSLPLRWSPRSC